MAKIISICFELISRRTARARKPLWTTGTTRQRKHFNSMIFLLANVQRYDGNKHDVKYDTLHFPVNRVKCHRLQAIYENSSVLFLFFFSFFFPYFFFLIQFYSNARFEISFLRGIHNTKALNYITTNPIPRDIQREKELLLTLCRNFTRNR